MEDSKNKKILGIVGIRSGSKGVPDKNIRHLLGKPLVGWILEKAKKSRYINRLVVSTDSEIYAEISRNFQAEIPCLRPKKLAQDKSSDLDYVKHMLLFLEEKENYIPDIVVRMMATVPFQKTEDIDAVIEILIKDKNADSSVVIAESRQHPQKALKIIDDKVYGKKLVSFFKESGREVTGIARQCYEKAYFRGNVIACKLPVIKKTNSLTGDIVRYHIIPQERAIDIDNEIDFKICETLLLS
tara:strand:+ start:1557 stop:2282 length:726 start_codon:yes stop_codon:yes gene_type:complete